MSLATILRNLWGAARSAPSTTKFMRGDLTWATPILPPSTVVLTNDATNLGAAFADGYEI